MIRNDIPKGFSLSAELLHVRETDYPLRLPGTYHSGASADRQSRRPLGHEHYAVDSLHAVVHG